MKKILIISVSYFIMTCTLFCQDKPKNIVGVASGVAPKIRDMYFAMPFNFWPNRELSPVFQFFYSRQMGDAFRIGSYLEYERINFSDHVGTDRSSFKRYNIGLNWMVQFPKTGFHLQLGGYFGYGFLEASDWNNQNGIDLGIIAGPAYEINRIGVALHLHSGHARYESSGTPEGVMLYTPRFLLKIYYKL